MNEKMLMKKNFIHSKIMTSNLPDEIKLNMASDLEDICEGTNGLTETEKIQQLTENAVHSMGYRVEIMTSLDTIERKLDAHCEREENRIPPQKTKLESLTDLALGVKWQIVIIALFITILLTFRPEIASVLGTVLGK